jgi:diguanylate cyclase (GGDEF)-like protein
MEQSWAAQGAAGFWQAVLDALTAQVAVLDREGRILAVNSAWRRFASTNGQTDPNACVGMNYLAVCDRALGSESGDDAAAVASGIRAVLSGERREFAIAYSCHSPKKRRWFMLRATPLADAGPARVVLAHENITAPKASQLRASRAVLELEVANRKLREQSRMVRRGRALREQSNRILELIARDELIDGILVEIALLVEKSLPGVRCAVARLRDGNIELAAPPAFPPALLERLRKNTIPALAGLGDQSLANLIVAVLDGAPAPDLPVHTEPICAADGLEAGWIAVAGAAPAEAAKAAMTRAASLAAIALDRAALHEKLSFQAGHDPVTELPNRLRFQEQAQSAANRRGADSRPFAIAILDLDRFGEVNELCGHSVGDGVLRLAGRRILECLRPGDYVARVCGDKFAVLLDGLRDAEEGAQLLSGIQEALARPFTILDQTVALTASSGLSMFPLDGSDAFELMRKADTALAWSRKVGPNTARRYRERMGARANERHEIQRGLPGAVGRDEFDIDYQLQFDTSGRVYGMEALARWDSVAAGRVLPDRFIPVAEESGLIVELGAFILRRACRQRVAWSEFDIPGARVSVNISPAQLRQPGFVELTSSILSESGLSPRLLELEVTETAMMTNIGHIAKTLERLRQIGIKIALDDFGTGYSSLSYLRTLPVDTIKIDRSFIRELKGGASGLSMLRAIIALSHSLDLSVIAEGVETEAQADALAALGCDAIQGFLFHRPAGAPEVTEVLESLKNGRSRVRVVA